jgi:hypothetical protein
MSPVVQRDARPASLGGRANGPHIAETRGHAANPAHAPPRPQLVMHVRARAKNRNCRPRDDFARLHAIALLHLHAAALEVAHQAELAVPWSMST